MIGIKDTPKLILLIWLILIADIVAALVLQKWSTGFVCLLTLALTVLPVIFSDRFEIKLPVHFSLAIVLFAFATLFLGEVRDFYNRFWWWDILLHGGSAVASGLFAFLLIFMIFDGDRNYAPPLAIAALSFFTAVAIGAIWEIFEFVMDQSVGTNMQKSGLMDTMWDLIIDCGGAFIGSLSGYLYLRFQTGRGLFSGLIKEFIDKNSKHYRKLDK